jgi:hypothetical protein
MLVKMMCALLLFVSLNSTAADDVDVVHLEKVMINTTNQFVYAFFGRTILTYYLTNDEDINAVTGARESDLIELSKPFNASSGSMVMACMSISYALTLLFFAIKLSGMLVASSWTLQKDGGLNFNSQEVRGIALKIVVVGALVAVPVSIKGELFDDVFYTNPATIILFGLVGMASEKSDESVVALVDGQRQSMTTITLPAADSKIESGQALNSFFVCVRLQSDRANKGEHTEKLDLFLEKGDVLSGSLSVGSCSLKVIMGVDTHSDQKIAKIIKQVPDVNLTKNLFISAQKEVFVSMLDQLILSATRYSSELSKPDYSASWDDGDRALTYQSVAALTLNEQKKWAQRCDELDSWHSSSPLGTISRVDRFYFHHLTARCQSKAVSDALVYPASYDAISSMIDNGGRTQKELALCVQQSSLTSELGESSFVAQYGIGAGEDGSSIEQISLDACIAEVCSANSLTNGSMYACTNSLDLYETALRSKKITERGTMALGFYMFDLFLHHPPSPSAKHVFNGFSISFSPEFTGSENPSSEPFLSLNVKIPPTSDNTGDFEPILGDMLREFGDTSLPTIYEEYELGDAGTLMGYTRLGVCVRNPLQVHAGYVCGNVPQEFSRFGMTILQNAIALKTTLIMGQAAGMMRKSIVSKGGTITPPPGNSDITTSFIRYSVGVSGAMLLGSNEYVYEVFDYVFGLKWNATDEFGYLNTARLNAFTNTAIVSTVASMAFLGADTGLIDIMDKALLIALLVGVLFAVLLPLMPMVMVISALSKFAYLLFLTIFMSDKKIIESGFDSNADFFNDGIDRVLADWLALILKLPLTVIGVVLSWLMSNVIISHVLSNMTIVSPTNDGIQGVIDVFVVMLITLVVIFVVYNMVLTVIESFYDFTVEWILETMHNNPFSSDTKAVGWKDSQEILHLLGRK